MTKQILLILLIISVTLTSSQLLQPNPCYQNKMRIFEDAVNDDLNTDVYNERVKIVTVMARFLCSSTEKQQKEVKREKYNRKNETIGENLECFKRELKKLKPESSLGSDQNVIECSQNIFADLKSDYENFVELSFNKLKLTQCTSENFTSQRDFIIAALEMIVVAHSDFNAEKIQQEEFKILQAFLNFAESVFSCIVKEYKN